MKKTNDLIYPGRRAPGYGYEIRERACQLTASYAKMIYGADNFSEQVILNQ